MTAVPPKEPNRVMSIAVIGVITTFFTFNILVDSVWAAVLYTAIHVYVTFDTLVTFFINRDREQEADILKNLINEATEWRNVSVDMKSIAKRIGKMLNYERGCILTVSADENDMKVVGSFGNFPKPIDGEKVPVGQSITGRAFQEEGPVCWNDVRRCNFFHRPYKEDDTRAEIAVPISYEGETFGVLSIQSTIEEMFGPSDVEALESIGRLIGLEVAVDLRKQFFDQVLGLSQAFQVEKVRTYVTDEIMIERFSAFVRSYFNADFVAYYPLSITGAPLERPYISGELPYHQIFDNAISSPDSPLLQMIGEWSPQFAPDMSQRSPLRAFFQPKHTTFYSRNHLQSGCFIPVGTLDNRLGAFIILFTNKTEFEKMIQYTLTSLVNQLVPNLAANRHFHITNEGFGKPELSVHNLINRHALKMGVHETAQSIQHNCELFKTNQCTWSENCKLMQMCHRLDNFLSDVTLVEATRNPDFRTTTLRKELDKYRKKFVAGRPVKLNINVDYKMVERESHWVELCLYSLITEAVNNAIFHGSADWIEINIDRDPKHIQLTVENNGKPLTEDSESKKSKHGIFFLLNELSTKMGAVTNFSAASQEGGATLAVSIPALPNEITKKAQNKWRI